MNVITECIDIQKILYLHVFFKIKRCKKDYTYTGHTII